LNLLHDTIRHHPADPIRHFIEKTTCNINKPLYNTIYLKSNKESIIQVTDGKDYVYISKKQAIRDLIERTRDILQEYKDSEQNIPEKFWEKCNSYLENVDNDKSEQMEDLRTEIVVMLLNLSKGMFTDEWKIKLKDQIEMYKNILTED